MLSMIVFSTIENLYEVTASLGECSFVHHYNGELLNWAIGVTNNV